MSRLRAVLSRGSVVPQHGGATPQPSRLIVDSALAIDDNLLLVVGWCESLAASEGLEIVAVEPGAGPSATAPAPLLRQRRPDVAAELGIETTDMIGFVGCVATSGQNPRELEFLGSGGEQWSVKVSATETIADVTHQLRACVASVDLASQVNAHVVPLVVHQVRTASDPDVQIVYQWPHGLSAAALNIVVPVYRNFDYLRNQLLAFSNLSGADRAISLVCDDPTITKSLLAWVRGWNAVYQVPLQVLAHDRNAGFAAACNTGARAVQSDLTLLLNSDVLPVLHPDDWLRRLTEPLDSGAAMTAPALLFPDGSVQHAGMSMEPSQDFAGFELPVHRWHGMPRSVLPQQPYTVPLLSGAALAITTSTFRDLGGMPTWLGKGDFEDVALSVAARQHGDLVVVPTVAWTHMQAASYDRSSESAVLLTLAKSQLFAGRNRSVNPAAQA